LDELLEPLNKRGHINFNFIILSKERKEVWLLLNCLNSLLLNENDEKLSPASDSRPYFQHCLSKLIFCIATPVTVTANVV
jgi:hypothetical protein